MTKKKITLISLAACALIIAGLFILLCRNSHCGGGGFAGVNQTNNAEGTNENQESTGISQHDSNVLFEPVHWQHRFYDKAPISRDSFSIRRILTQTDGGDFIAEVCWGNMWNPPGIAHPGARQQYQAPSNIMIVDADLASGRFFFADNPEWTGYYFAASCLVGYIYFLVHASGESGQDTFATLYTYNQYGVMISQHKWDKSVSSLFINDAFVIDGTVILNTHFALIFISKQGEVLFEIERPYAITAGGGYLFGIYQEGEIFLRKIDVATGQTVWERELGHYYNNEIVLDLAPSLAFCESTQQLYIYQHNALFIFDERTKGLLRVKDLAHSESNIQVTRRVFSDEPFAASGNISIADNGLIHLVWRSVYREQGYISSCEWVLTRLIDDAALERMAEIAQIEADIPIIRTFGYWPNTFNLIDLFAYDRGARTQASFVPADAWEAWGWAAYIEMLNAAIFAGTANYDIVNMFPQYHLRSYINRGLLIDFTDFVGDRFTNNEVYFANLFEIMKVDGGLYYLPGEVDVPVLLVPLDFPDLERLRSLSLNWTWADFLEIAQEVANETGVPPITDRNAIYWAGRPEFWFPFPSNTPQFYLFAEDVLRDLGAGGSREAFASILETFYALASPELNQPLGEGGVFTFETFIPLVHVSRAGISYVDFLDTHAVLPIPSSHGERHFSLYSIAQAVLTTGESTDLAVEFLLEEFDNNPFTINSPFAVTRPSREMIERYVSVDMFNEYVEILENTNTVLWLPPSVTVAISETVESLLHGALTLEAAVNRIADIMWLYVNE